VRETEHFTGVGPVATLVVVELQSRTANASASAAARSSSGRAGEGTDGPGYTEDLD
jgi:hypothetical protein